MWCKKKASDLDGDRPGSGSWFCLPVFSSFYQVILYNRQPQVLMAYRNICFFLTLPGSGCRSVATALSQAKDSRVLLISRKLVIKVAIRAWLFMAEGTGARNQTEPSNHI